MISVSKGSRLASSARNAAALTAFFTTNVPAAPMLTTANSAIFFANAAG